MSQNVLPGSAQVKWDQVGSKGKPLRGLPKGTNGPAPRLPGPSFLPL